MNAARRKSLAELAGKITDLVSEVETFRDEEQEYYDNMPENMQGGDKGQAAESAVAALDEASNSLNEAVSQIEEAST